MASIRAVVREQENAQVGFHSKSGAQGRTNGPVKGLRFQNGLETPRRALGDVGNIFKTPGNLAEKSTMLKSTQQQHIKSAKQKIKSTPLGSHKQKSAFKTMKREVFQEKEWSYEKERMFPYVDEDKPLPRSEAVKTILDNVSHIYRGCLHSTSYKNKPLYIDEKPNIDNLERLPLHTDTSDAFSWLPNVGDSLLEISDLPSGVDDLELPPLDTDLTGLGLP